MASALLWAFLEGFLVESKEIRSMFGPLRQWAQRTGLLGVQALRPSGLNPPRKGFPLAGSLKLAHRGLQEPIFIYRADDSYADFKV